MHPGERQLAGCAPLPVSQLLHTLHQLQVPLKGLLLIARPLRSPVIFPATEQQQSRWPTGQSNPALWELHRQGPSHQINRLAGKIFSLKVGGLELAREESSAQGRVCYYADAQLSQGGYNLCLQKQQRNLSG